MKSYTDIEQSKKLAEMLPLESADMGFYYSKDPYDARNQMWVGTKVENSDIPCWSLSALLEYLKQHYYVRLDHDGVSWSITCIEHDTDKKYTSSMFDDPVDACWGMMLRINKDE